MQIRCNHTLAGLLDIPIDMETFDMTGGGGQINLSASDDSMHMNGIV